MHRVCFGALNAATRGNAPANSPVYELYSCTLRNAVTGKFDVCAEGADLGRGDQLQKAARSSFDAQALADGSPQHSDDVRPWRAYPSSAPTRQIEQDPLGAAVVIALTAGLRKGEVLA